MQVTFNGQRESLTTRVNVTVKPPGYRADSPACSVTGSLKRDDADAHARARTRRSERFLIIRTTCACRIRDRHLAAGDRRYPGDTHCRFGAQADERTRSTTVRR